MMANLFQPLFFLLWLPSLQAAVSGNPCPKDANLWNCVDWCKIVAPGSAGTFGGEVCAHLGNDAWSTPSLWPRCQCYGENFERVLEECSSPCPRPNVADLDDDDEEICTVSGAGCLVADTTERYLLYDVKIGEGFNLQREIYPRVGTLVWSLNERVKIKCAGKFGKGHCSPWTLVLPPWCRLAHWRSNSTRIPWKRFFDTEALRSSEVRVLEFEEFAGIVGGAQVDVAVTLTDERVAEQERHNQRGGFYGWAIDLNVCKDASHHVWNGPATSNAYQWTIPYSGDCDGGLQAKEARCGIVSSRMFRDVVDMLLGISNNVTSVILRHCDNLAPPENNEMDALGLRESMLFSSHIREAGNDFIKTVIGSKPFLAVHCRRTDFIQARAKTTPDHASLTFQINAALKMLGYSTVFVATDAVAELQTVLEQGINGRVIFPPDLSGFAAHSIHHPGELAAFEMWVAAQANHFVGTKESRFTSHVQLERSWLGHPASTSIQEFCKEISTTRCETRSTRQAKREGRYHAGLRIM